MYPSKEIIDVYVQIKYFAGQICIFNTWKIT